jgi:phosphopantetheinyl transferase
VHRSSSPSFRLALVSVSRLPATTAWLDADERICAASLAAPARRDWVAGRLAAKRVAASLAGIPLSRIRLRDGRDGTPEIDDVPSRHIALSLAHAEGHAIAVATDGTLAIGVDLERAGRVAPGHARYFLSARERRRHDDGDAVVLWTLKEAAWKALRCPPSTPLGALELRRATGGRISGVELHGRVYPARAVLGRPWSGFVAAIVLVGDAA